MKPLNSRMGLFELFAALNLNTDGRSLLQKRRKAEESKAELPKTNIKAVGETVITSVQTESQPAKVIQKRVPVVRTRRERKARQLKKEKFLKSIRVVALPRNKKREPVRA